MLQKIVAIVPTYNRIDLFKKAYASVLNQTLLPNNFLILSNGCTDSTNEFLEKTNSIINIKVYKEPINLGASQGMRFLFDRALELKPDWIWVMDDDAIAEPDALKNLVESEVFKNPDTYILESMILDQNKKWSPPNRPAVFDPKSFEFKGLDENVVSSKKPIEVHTGGYCGLLIRREAFEEFGYPESKLFLWYDDTDYLLKVSRTKKIYLIPQSKIQHFAQALVPQIKVWPFSGPLPKVPENLIWRYYYGQRNWLWLAKKWLPTRKYIPFFTRNLIRNLAAPILLKQNRKFYRMKISLTAACDAVRGRLGERRFD